MFLTDQTKNYQELSVKIGFLYGNLFKMYLVFAFNCLGQF